MQQVEVIPSWASVLFLFHLSPVTTLKKIASWYPIWLQVQFSGVAFICPQCHLHGRQQPLLKFYIIWDHPGALKELRMQGQNSTILVINSSEKKKINCAEEKWQHLFLPSRCLKHNVAAELQGLREEILFACCRYWSP